MYMHIAINIHNYLHISQSTYIHIATYSDAYNLCRIVVLKLPISTSSIKLYDKSLQTQNKSP